MAIGRLLDNSLLFLIRLYRFLLKPWVGHHCRFEPSCSQYALDAVQQYGSGRGLLYIFKRLLRCHPFHPGGMDFLPATTKASDHD